MLAISLPYGSFAQTQASLVGTWELLTGGSRLTIEFRTGGEFRAVTGLGDYSGQWQDVDGKYLQTWSDGRRPRRTNVYYFADNQLVIVDEVGTRHRHNRLK